MAAQQIHRAQRWLQVANHGSLLAQLQLGNLYDADGNGVPQGYV
jgi:hypothetical protein